MTAHAFTSSADAAVAVARCINHPGINILAIRTIQTWPPFSGQFKVVGWLVKLGFSGLFRKMNPHIWGVNYEIPLYLRFHANSSIEKNGLQGA
jgi:hypothetical protein